MERAAHIFSMVSWPHLCCVILTSMLLPMHTKNHGANVCSKPPPYVRLCLHVLIQWEVSVLDFMPTVQVERGCFHAGWDLYWLNKWTSTKCSAQVWLSSIKCTFMWTVKGKLKRYCSIVLLADVPECHQGLKLILWSTCVILNNVQNNQL